MQTGARLLSRCTHFTNPHIRFSMLRLLKCRAPKISSCYTIFMQTGARLLSRCTHFTNLLLEWWEGAKEKHPAKWVLVVSVEAWCYIITK